MKRYRFVLVLLILIVATTGCRRRMNLFGRRGAQCGAQPVYSQGAIATTGISCPTVCPDDTCPVGSYGGEVYGGEVIGDSYGTVIDGSYGGEVYNGASIPTGGTVFGDVPYGSDIPYGDLSPTLPNSSSSFGPNVHGRPAFQVVGDRKVNPGESLPPLENDVAAAAQPDKTAQAPKK